MKALDFVYQSRQTRVVFGARRLDGVSDELEMLNSRRALVLCTPEQRELADDVVRRLDQRAAALFDRAVMHVPVDTVNAALEVAHDARADCVVAAGGGSTIGLAKAMALKTSLPILAIPTTYAGSEMTTIYGTTEGGLKTTGRDDRVLPRTVIYDPELLRTLPSKVAVTSGLNAIAHAAEGLYAHDGNPIMSLFAEEGIRALATALPRIEDQEARVEALYGAWLCGLVLSSVAMGLHHKLCHTLGGSYNLPHAETHAVMLPHTLAYNASHAQGAMGRLARALDTDDGPRGLFALLRSTGSPRSLRELGMPEEGLDLVADLAVQSPYPNPRPLEKAPMRALLQRAFEGAPPD